MTTYTTEDRIEAEKEMGKEQCYLLTVKIVKGQLIPWPSNVDSELWNGRVNALLKDLTIAFGFDGENE